MELLVGTLPNMLSISKGQKDRDARRFAVEPSKQTCSKPSMDCDAVEKLSLDDKFPLFTKSLEGASVPVQPPTRGQSQLTVQSAYTAGSHPTKAAIVTATKEAKAALTSSRKPKWTPEQKRQRREQRALQGENKTPRGRSNGQRQVASERDSRIDGGVSIIPEFEAKGAAKPKPITTTLPVRSARKASLDKKIYSASENTLEAKMTSIKAAHHLSTSITNLNPNAPTYKPTKLAPAGGLYNPQYQNSQPFVPYQPMRFASAVATQNSFPSPPNGSSSAKGRPTALTSQADRQAKFNIPKGIATANPLLSALHKDPKLHRNAPQPTVAYIEQSSLPPRPSAKPGNLLLVLDINGTLLYRRKRTTHIYPRPSLKEFLNYCLKTHSVLVWSSAQPVNVDMICSRIFSPAERSQLVAEWGRNTLELSAADYRQNIQVYKRLDRIWKDDRVQVHHLRYAQGERWSQKNTVLIDDSMLKALAQPFNHIEVPEFDLKNGNFSDGDGTEVLGQVVAYLEELRAWEDVSSFMRQERFVLNGGYRWDWATGRRVCPDSREDL